VTQGPVPVFDTGHENHDDEEDDRPPPSPLEVVDVSDLWESVNGRVPGPSASSGTISHGPGQELQSGDEAATPSRRQGTRSGRARLPPGGRRGDEDLVDHVVYASRPSMRRAPTARHG
jgi:hypothetical protein